MDHDKLLRRIRDAAKRDEKRRRDPRYLTTLGFLVAKGFLRTNEPVPLLPNHRIRIDDAFWAGTTLEPRILEVLPAAILRLPKHFDLDRNRHVELHAAVELLRRGETEGPPLWNIEFRKLVPWVSLPLRDRRLKPPAEKRIMKAFRLTPTAISRLQTFAEKLGCDATQALETALERAVAKK